MNTKISEHILKRMRCLSQEFFWNNDSYSNKMNLIGWDTITRYKKDGGLGIHDLKLVRKALRAKRILPLLNNDDIL